MIRLLVVAGLSLVPCLAAGAGEGQEQADREFPTGKIIAKVVTEHEEKQSYALYLPKAYSRSRKWPILYGFSPAGRGRDPVLLFQRAAEKYGWIVVGSNNSRNGPWKPIAAALRAIVKDTQKRLTVAPERRYATGFSGGARVASHLARSAKPPFAGVISIGAGLARKQKAPGKNAPPVYFAICGARDFNHGELLSLERALLVRGVRHRFQTFNGGHRWPPVPMAEAAIRYMELLWHARGDLSAAAPQKILKAEARDAEELLGVRGQYARGYRRVSSLAQLSTGTPAGQELAKKLAKITSSERHKTEKPAMEAVAALNKQVEGQRDLVRRLLTQHRGVSQMEPQFKDTDTLLAARVDLRMQAQRVGMGGIQLVRAKRFKQAEAWLQAARQVYPSNAQLAYASACVLAQLGKKEQAVKALEEAVDLGLKNVAQIEANSLLKPIREEAGYRKVVESLREQKKDDPAAVVPVT